MIIGVVLLSAASALSPISFAYYNSVSHQIYRRCNSALPIGEKYLKYKFLHIPLINPEWPQPQKLANSQIKIWLLASQKENINTFSIIKICFNGGIIQISYASYWAFKKLKPSIQKALHPQCFDKFFVFVIKEIESLEITTSAFARCSQSKQQIHHCHNQQRREFQNNFFAVFVCQAIKAPSSLNSFWTDLFLSAKNITLSFSF